MSVEIYFLILARITPVMFFKSINPISMLPSYIKLVVSLIMALLIFFGLDTSELMQYTVDNVELSLALLIEFYVGCVFWFSLLSAYGALITLLKIVDMQVGVSPVGVFNPATNESDPILGRIILIFTFLIFLIEGMHLVLVDFLFASLKLYPIGSGLGEWGWQQLVAGLQSQFILAVLIVMPISMALFVLDIILGMCNKLMPQVSIYFVGLPAKIMVAVYVLMHSANYVIEMATRINQTLHLNLLRLI